MQVSVETTEGLERRMQVTLPADRINSEIEKRLNSLSKTVRLKGFRPGKVPMKVVRSQYGSRVRHEVLDELTRNSFYEAVSKENLKLAGYPAFEAAEQEGSEDFSYIATFEILSEFELAPVSDIEVKRPVVELGDEDLDKMIEKLRRQSCSWNPVDRAAQDTDRLVIDFVGTIDGEAFAGGEGKDVPVVLGSKAMIAGFEEGLTGATTGQELTLALTFPEDYHNRELAGKDASFAIAVKTVEEAELPEVDEDFARRYEIEDGNLELFREEIMKSMQIEVEEAVRMRLKQQVMDALFDRNPVALPKSQVASVLEDLKQQRAGQELDEAELRRTAERNVALGLIVNKIINEQSLKADAIKVRSRVESVAAGYDDPDQVIAWYYGDRQRLGNVEAIVLEDAVVDWVIENASVTDEPVGFDELVGGSN